MQETIFNGSDRVPEEIVAALRRLIRRARTSIALRGACAVGAVAIGSILAVMAVDASVVLFSPWARWILSGIAYGAILLAIMGFLIRPLAHSFTLTGMARIIESRHPEMQERISSVVEILTSQDRPELRGSEALIEALTREAIHDVQIVNPGKEVSMRKATPVLIAVVGLSIVFCGLFVFLPRQTTFLLTRATAPFVNLPNLHAADLKVTPGDCLVGEGSRVQILVTVANPSVTTAHLRRSGSGEDEIVEDMSLTSSAPGQDRAFCFILPAVKETFRYRVHAGDALTKYYKVRVVPPPAIAGVDLAFQYPDYSDMPSKVELDSGGAIRSLIGTTVDGVARINKFVKSADVTVTTTAGSTNITGMVSQRDDGQFVCTFRIHVTSGLSGLWAIKLTDEFDLSNPKYERAIEAIPDKVPQAKVLHLEQKEIRLNPSESLPVFYSAEDDLGLSAVTMLLVVDGKTYEEPLVTSKGGEKPGKAVQGEAALDLSQRRFKNAQRIIFQVKASDNMPVAWNGPQSGMSSIYTVFLDANMPSFDEQVLNSQEQKLKQELQKAQQQLTAARTISQPLSEAIAKEQKTLSENAAKQIEQAQNYLTAAEKAVRDVAEETKDGFYGDFDDRLKDLAEEHIGKAGNLTDQIRLTDEPQQREKMAKDAASEVEKSIAAIQDMLKDLETITPTVRRAVELSHLAERQDRLTRAGLAMNQAKGTNAVTDMTPDEWKKAQDKIADDLSRLVKSAPGATNDAAEAIRQQVSDAAEAASRLAEEQQALSEQTKRLAALQKADKILQDLAKEQSILAAQIRTNAILSNQFEPMKHVAEAISANDLEKAIPEQASIVAALTNKVEELKHPLPPDEQQNEAQKIADLGKSQDALLKKVTALTDQQNKELQQIAGEQAKLATEAKTSPLAAPQADAMMRAAEALKAEQPHQALAQQEAAKKGLQAAQNQLLHPAPTPQQQQDAQKAAELANRQRELGKKVADLTEQRNKALQDLAVEQDKLAAQAKDNPLAAPQAKIMARAAEEIKTDQPRKAMADQESAAKAISAAADKLKQTPKPTPEQQQNAQKADELAKQEKDLKNKVAALTEQRNKALQELAGEQAKLAAEAMAAPVASGQFTPMTKAAEAIKNDQPRSAMPQQETVAKALEAAAEQAKNPPPTDQQKQDASKLANLEKKQEVLKERLENLIEQRAKAFQDLAEEQETLAKEARGNSRTTNQAEAMAKAAEAIKTEQPRQAIPQQQATRKALEEAAAQMRQSPQPTPQQQQDAQIAADAARRQEEIKKKATDLAEQAKKALLDMASEQRSLATEAKANPPTAKMVDEMVKAADALKAGQPEKAVPSQIATAKAMREALDALEHPTPTPEQEKSARKIADLAKDQEELQKKLTNTLEDRKKELANMAVEQRNLAEKAKANPLVAAQAPSLSHIADELKTDQPKKARADQETDEKALAAAAERIQQNPKATAAQQQQAEKAMALAKELGALRKDLTDLLQDQHEEMMDVAKAQENLAEQAKSDPNSLPQSAPMKKAVEALNLEQPQNALREQAAAEKGLAATAYRMGHPQPTPQEQQQAQRTEALMNRQEALRQKVADFNARDNGIFSAQREEQIDNLQEKQDELAQKADRLADDIKAVAPQDDRLEMQASKAANEAARSFAQNDLAEAGRNAVKASADMGRLARHLEDSARTELAARNESTAPHVSQTPEPEKLMDLAERAGSIADEQEQLAHETMALAADKPMTALLEQQRTLAEQATDLSRLAAVVKEQTSDLGMPPQTLQEAVRSADQASRAVESSAQASKLLQDSMTPSPSTSELPPQTQQAILQTQSAAAQALDSAAKALENVQRMLAQSAPLSAPSSENKDLPEAYQQAREAAENQNPLDAMQASDAIARAAQQAAQQAQALGANPNPDFPQTLSSTGGGIDPTKPVEGEAPTWGFKVGMKLRNWLHLQGELQDEVLQASNDEGPEEYRTLIKSYFQEVSRRGGEEP